MARKSHKGGKGGKVPRRNKPLHTERPQSKMNQPDTPSPPDTPPAGETLGNGLGGIPRPVLWRLVVNLVLGVLFVGWLVKFTDWGEDFLKLIALGGVFSWVATVAKILSKDRQEQLQRLLAEWLVESDKAKWVTRAFVVFFVFTTVVGVIEVENVQGGGDSVVRVYRGEKDPGRDEDERLPNGGRVRYCYPIAPWGRTEVRVKASRLPTATVQLRPWWRGGAERVQVVGSFLRPVVLVAGGEQAVAEGKKHEYRLQIFVNGKSTPEYDQPFDGRSVLLGSEETDLAIPERLRTAPGWKDVGAAYEDTLFPPRGVAVELKAGDKVTAFLLNKDNVPHPATGVVVVRPVWEVGEMVQGLLLVPKKKGSP